MAIVFRTGIAIITCLGIGGRADTLLACGSARTQARIFTHHAIGFGWIITDAGHGIAHACQVAIIDRFARINRARKTNPLFAMVVDCTQVPILTQGSCRWSSQTTLDHITEVIGARIAIITDLIGAYTRARLAPIQFGTNLTIVTREILKIRWMCAHTAVTDVLRAYVVVVGTVRRVAERGTTDTGSTRIISAFVSVITIDR